MKLFGKIQKTTLREWYLYIEIAGDFVYNTVEKLFCHYCERFWRGRV